jgi:hypothetical protein
MGLSIADMGFEEWLDMMEDRGYDIDELTAEDYESAIERAELRELQQEERENAIRSQIQDARSNFAYIGTNKAKRRLNKLGEKCPIAKAIRVALEAEDNNLCAKESYGKYKEKIYRRKSRNIVELISIFKENGWNYGIGVSDTHKTTNIIYFDMPLDGKQISWHYSPAENANLPLYSGVWDGLEHSTFGKLSGLAAKVLGTVPEETHVEQV